MPNLKEQNSFTRLKSFFIFSFAIVFISSLLSTLGYIKSPLENDSYNLLGDLNINDVLQANLFEEVGSVRTVNLSSEPSAFDMGASADGGFVIVWNQIISSGNASDSKITLERYNKDGRKVGGGQIVNANPNKNAYDPSISVTSDGTYAVAWAEFDSSGNSQIYARRYKSDDTPIDTSPIRVTDNRSDKDVKKPSIAMNENKSFLVAWQIGDLNDIEFDSVGKELKAKIYTESNGILSSSDVSFSPPRGFVGVSGFMDSSINKNGKYAVTFRGEGNPNSDQIHKGIYTVSNITGSNLETNTSQGGILDYPSVFIDEKNNMVVSWKFTSNNDNSTEDVFIDFYKNGSIANNDFLVNTPSPDIAYFKPFSVISNSDEVIIYYLKQNFSNGNIDVFANLYDSTLTLKEGPKEIVKDISIDIGFYNYVFKLNDNRFLSSWVDGSGKKLNFVVSGAKPPVADTDGDGVKDDVDNCIEDKNPDQKDTDEDGIGDVCDDAPSVKSSGGSSRPRCSPGDTSCNEVLNIPKVEFEFRKNEDEEKTSIEYFGYFLEPYVSESEKTSTSSQPSTQIDRGGKEKKLKASEFLKESKCLYLSKFDFGINDFVTYPDSGEDFELEKGDILKTECDKERKFTLDGTKTTDEFSFEFYFSKVDIKNIKKKVGSGSLVNTKNVISSDVKKDLETDPRGLEFFISLHETKEVTKDFVQTFISTKFPKFDPKVMEIFIEKFNFDKQEFEPDISLALLSDLVYKIRVDDRSMEILNQKFDLGKDKDGKQIPFRVGEDFEFEMQVKNGEAPYIWSIDTLKAPDGCSIIPSRGIFYCTPTESGYFSFDITVKDSNNNSKSKKFDIFIEASEESCFIGKYIECENSSTELGFITCIMQKYAKDWVKTSLFGN